MSNTVRMYLVSRKPLNLPIQVRGTPGHLTACWTDGRVEVTTTGTARIYSPAELIVLAPELLPALTAMLHEVCSDQAASAQIRLMNKALERSRYRGVAVKNGTYRSSEEREALKNSNRAKRQQAEVDLMRGLILVNSRLNTFHLQAVSADGKTWLINGQRGSLEDLVQAAPLTILVDLLFLAKPYLANAGGLYRALCAAIPSLCEDDRMAVYTQSGPAGAVGRRHQGFEWVADALAQRSAHQSDHRPESRPLHNRVRHIR